MIATNFWLCEIGCGLYLAWAELEDSQPDTPQAAEAKKAYIQHREGCSVCSKQNQNTMSKGEIE